MGGLVRKLDNRIPYVGILLWSSQFMHGSSSGHVYCSTRRVGDIHSGMLLYDMVFEAGY